MHCFNVAFVLIAGCLLASSVQAQASVNITGTVPDDRSHLILVEVDFGSTSQSLTLDVSIAATGGTSGLDVDLVDLDELAASGSATGTMNAADSGTGTIVINMTTPSYSGVHQFALEVETDAANGPSPYSGTFSCATLTAGAIVKAGSKSWPYVDGYTVFFGRASRLVTTTSSAGTTSRDVVCEFGSVAQAATFYVQGLSFFDDGTIDVYEVLSGGTESLLGTLTLNTGTGWEEENNFTTSARSGTVTIRLKITTALTSSAFYAWNVVVPNTVAISSGGSGGGGGGGGGCSTEGGTGLSMLALLGIISLVGVAVRLRS
ncbi:MAG: hypothetical protein KDB90_14395 [Planctomycetes bacterium]|nr:hypothetical protein [Planctomycetota bacterium]